MPSHGNVHWLIFHPKRGSHAQTLIVHSLSKLQLKKKKKGKTAFSARPAFNTCKGQRVPKYSRPHLSITTPTRPHFSITTPTSFQRGFRIQDLDESPLAAPTKAPCCVVSVWRQEEGTGVSSRREVPKSGAAVKSSKTHIPAEAWPRQVLRKVSQLGTRTARLQGATKECWCGKFSGYTTLQDANSLCVRKGRN